ncbi:MAG TPA: protein-disulfide reductase DsbD [Gammaproteobacteria bacterium]|nr:protein-disulfide reductase DsbD [Gammaproteobacteria bacterium]
MMRILLLMLAALAPQFAAAEPELLRAEQAFPYTAELREDELVLQWDVADGYYLYRKSLAFRSLDAGVELDTPDLPPGQPYEDEFFGESRIYRGRVEARIPVSGTPAGEFLAIEVKSQGCADIGICLPPQTWRTEVPLGGAAAQSPRPASGRSLLSFLGADGQAAQAPGAQPASPATATDRRSGAPVSESDRLAALISGGALPAVLAVFFGFGLLLAFTPCVLPMVPILSGLIIGQGPDVTTRRAFALSAVFVLAMALTYTLAGIVVAMLGHNLQATFQHPAVLIGFSLVFVALALAMFGFYELQVPAGLQTKMSALSNRQQAGTWLGAGTMGVFSALIVGPCVAAPLAAALIVIGASGDPVRGGAALFALSMGMGAPLLAFGASAGKLLPGAGAWMETIKNLFGLLLLGVAVWMLERIVPPAVALALWAGLFFLAAMFLGALDPLTGSAGPGRRIAKGLALMSLLYGAVLLVGAAAGGSSIWQPLATLRSAGTGARPAVAAEFRTVKSVADLEAELSRAGAAGSTVMLDFYADWCVDCKRMERYTFTQADVQAALDGTVLLKADVTANDTDDRELMNRFGIYGPPAILFFGTNGAELRPYRLFGFMPAERFAAHVRAARGRADGTL